MKLKVISLACQGSRWQAARRQFQSAGLLPLREEAVRGESLAPWQREQLYSAALNRQQYHRPLRLGEIGCYASHLAVWQALLESDEHCVAVFEDDVEVAPDMSWVLAAIARLGRGWDLIKLIGRPREKVLARSALSPGHDLIRYRRVPSFTSAYVLHRRGAEKLLARRQPFGRPVDVDIRYWWECRLEILGVLPYPAFHAPSSRHSCISGRRDEPPGVAARLHKLYLQARYTLLNGLATREAGKSRAWSDGRAGALGLEAPAGVSGLAAEVASPEHDHA